MIINLNLKNKKVVVIGGGNEAEKRIKSILGQDCKIVIISESVSDEIKKIIKLNKIKFLNQKIQNMKFISETKPDIIITTTDNKNLNQKIIRSAKKRKIIVYSSDNPNDSDFANLSVMDFDKTIQIAIFTGGQSPAMAKKIRMKTEKILKKTITNLDINQVKIQNFARHLAKNEILEQIKRKEYLNSVLIDKKIDQLIKDGQIKKAENRAVVLLRNWK